MLKLRKFLRACFGLTALVYGGALFEMVKDLRRVFHVPHPDSYWQAHWLAAAGVLTLSILIQLAPSAIAVCCAAAWFTLRLGRPSGRRWAIAAVTAMLVVDIMLAIGVAIIWAYARNQAHAGFGKFLFAMMIMIWLPLAAFGILGLVAFWKVDSEALSELAVRKQPRISGDGTTPWTDVLSIVIALAGFLGGLYYWERWGRSHHLPGYRHGFPLTLIILGVLITTAIHEAGHATIGMAIGMKLRAFVVGPFQWRLRDGKWRFQFVVKTLFGGVTELVPANPNLNPKRESLMVAAGPMTELFFGIAAFALLLSARGTAYEPMWGLLAVIVTLSTLGFIGNLIPMNPEGLYSDGARIYQLRKGGAWSDFHRATTLAESTIVTPLRPRDYDIEVIKRAGQFFTRGQQAVLLRLLASSYYLDRGDLEQASQSTAEAETISRELGINLPAELRIGLVFRIAMLLNDAGCASSFWAPLESMKAVYKGSDYWLAKSALLFSERKIDEARNAWRTAYDLVRELPTAGDCEFDRDRCELLRKAIESATVNALKSPVIASV